MENLSLSSRLGNISKPLVILFMLFITTSFMTHDLSAVDPRTNAPLLYSLSAQTGGVGTGSATLPSTISQIANITSTVGPIQTVTGIFALPISTTINGITANVINYQLFSVSPNLQVNLYTPSTRILLTFNLAMTGGTWLASADSIPGTSSGTFTVVAVPEPATILLLTSATAFTGMLRKRVKTS